MTTGFDDNRRQQIATQLDRILASQTFSASERHRAFLRFVVEQALKGDTDKLNEFVLGFEVFNKGDSFDPRIDSIVRVEARRLRERLKKYYAEEGAADPLVVTIRPRSFIPEFAARGEAPAAGAAEPRDGWYRRHRTAIVAVAALLLGIASTLTGLHWRFRGPMGPPQMVSVLVVPFQVSAAGAGQDVLGKSMADALITGLANVPGVRVLSANTPEGLRVDYIVQGSLQVKGAQARVSANLTDTRAQSYIWADTRETPVDRLNDLQRIFTGLISARLRVPLPPGGGDMVPRRRPANIDAYTSFLKGQYYWHQSEPDSAEKSIALFQDATRRDPDFAPAWAWLAQSYLHQIHRDDGRDTALIAQGRQAAARALSLDPQLAEAHAAAGSYAALDWDWSRADASFRRAIQLNPGWAQGHVLYGVLYLLPAGQLREAAGELMRAHELDPLTRSTRVMLAEVFYYNRDYTRAIAESEDLARSSSTPNLSNRTYLLSLSLSNQGARALTELGKLPEPRPEITPGDALAGYLMARHGRAAEARALLARMSRAAQQGYVSPLFFAQIELALGDKNAALAHLQSALAAHVPLLSFVAVDPVFAPLRDEPRFQQIVRGAGLRPLP